MTCQQYQQELDHLLQGAGCQGYSAEEARADMQECWRGVREDAVAQGESPDEPFFSFVVAGGVGVFTFFEGSVSIFVIRGTESEFRARFDPLAMGQVKEAKGILAKSFRKTEADLLVPLPTSLEWLGSASGSFAS